LQSSSTKDLKIKEKTSVKTDIRKNFPVRSSKEETSGGERDYRHKSIDYAGELVKGKHKIPTQDELKNQLKLYQVR